MASADFQRKVEQASELIRPHVRHTPTEFSHWLSKLGNAQVYIKWDSEQLTGSAKARGAFHKLLALKQRDPALIKNGAIAASTGNHGLACSKAMSILGIKGVVYVPDMVDPQKKKMIEENGSMVKIVGHTCAEAEHEARVESEDKEIPYVSPSNDWDVMEGQGTLGLELYQDLPSVDVVFVAVGGGGLIGGIASYLKAVKPSIQVVGCETEMSPVMSKSVQAGKILEMPSGDTLSDGTSGGAEQGSVAFPVCQEVVDDWVVVTEEEIAKAVYEVMDKHHKIVEGSAGVSFASYIKTRQRWEGKTVAIVACGSNISMKNLKMIIQKFG
ncbi:L-threonine ammonia-lyase isoform X1 [Nematostella vectensis]|uniref:L-threonine ammonia-lyase isoform X1 n=1 Tax=Nematostella vectensis TaxID=45351 RepID=UPI0020775288|nr:L-threonine ammonia-lyase isoform X1 [Nematostella vectensis]XP_048583825.1 L-threonine ammonia-lyase isoform X1 [Nematostella vectensis]